jgi:adenylate cyclase
MNTPAEIPSFQYPAAPNDAATLALVDTVKAAEADSDLAAISAATSKLGKHLLISGEADSALDTYLQSVQYAELLGETLQVAHRQNNIGTIYFGKEIYALALSYFFKALQHYELANYTKGILSAYVNIGGIEERMGRSAAALEYYDKAISLANAVDDKLISAMGLMNKGVVLRNSENAKDALGALLQALEMFKTLNDQQNITRCYLNIGIYFLDNHQPDEALKYFNLSLNLSREINDSRYECYSLDNMGEAYFNKGDLDQASAHLKLALDKAQATGQKESIKTSYKLLYQIAEEKEEYKEAHFIFKQHIQVKEELLNMEGHRQINELKLSHDLENKAREAEINHLRNVELKNALDSLSLEQKRSQTLLLNILPEEVAEELKENGRAEAKHYDQVSVMFIDIKDFTQTSELLSPVELVKELDNLFRGFDDIIDHHKLEKIKTIGDAYMCAGGIPIVEDDHPKRIVKASLEMLQYAQKLKDERDKSGRPAFAIRIGIHTGPVVAGIVGSRKFAYDIWGDTVNTASRIESAGEAGKVNISQATYELIKDDFICQYRGKLPMKHKADSEMYFVLSDK